MAHSLPAHRVAAYFSVYQTYYRCMTEGKVDEAAYWIGIADQISSVFPEVVSGAEEVGLQLIKKALA